MTDLEGKTAVTADEARGGVSTPARTRRSREGLKTGIIGATIVWLWYVAGDGLAGTPFSTPAVMGGGLLSVGGKLVDTPMWVAVTTFTLWHYAVWIGFGALTIAAVRAAARTRGLLIGMVVAFILVQFAFVGFTLTLSESRMGPAAWRLMLIGNAIGVGVSGWYIIRGHPELRAEIASVGDDD